MTIPTPRLRTLAAALVLAASVPLAAQSFPIPPGWKWVPDAPVALTDRLGPPDGSFLFGTMAPGWHITTRPGVVLFEPSAMAMGRFVIESESFIFPGRSMEGFGVFAGGRDLESAEAAYTAFLIRRDGRAAIVRHEGGRTRALREWTAAAAIKAHPGDDTNVANVIRVEAEADVVGFHVNGVKVLEVPRAEAAVDGVVGLRIGADTDIHVTNLDVTRRLALPRPARPGE